MRTDGRCLQELSLAERSADTDWIVVVTQKQEQLAASVSKYTAAQALHAMRCQPSKSKVTAAFWRHFNRAGRGFLHTGSDVPDVLLYDVRQQQYTSLLQQLLPQGKTLLVAGSIS